LGVAVDGKEGAGVVLVVDVVVKTEIANSLVLQDLFLELLELLLLLFVDQFVRIPHQIHPQFRVH
jgi:hypothetical protein